MIVLVLAFLVLLVLAALCSGMETGLYSLERVRLEMGATRGDRPAKRLLGALANPAPTLCALLIAVNVVHYLMAFVSDHMMAAWFDGLSPMAELVVNTLILGAVLFVFGDLVPKNVFMQAPFGLMRACQPLLGAIRVFFAPIALPLVWLMGLGRAEASATRRESVFDRGSIHYLLTAEGEASLTPAQRRLAERVLVLRTLRVQDRMVPLKQTSAVRAGATAAEVVAEGARSGHSRLPVWAADGKRFAGYVAVIDAATAEGRFSLEDCLHDLPEFSCDLPVTTALYRLQRAGRPIAAVVTPDGRTVLGIVTVSDIVSALFVV